MLRYMIDGWKLTFICSTRLDPTGRLIHESLLISLAPSAEACTTDSWSVGPMPLLNSSLGVPNAPADEMTLPVPGVRFTVPAYPDPAEHETSTPVARGPLRTMRSAAVSVHSVKTSLLRAAALARYVARGPPRSPPPNMNCPCPKVRFFFSGTSLPTTYSHPLALRPLVRTS